jgi:UDP-N-acetylmuramoyl-L-alanyl-D-glutamate--2,6-diaminopimelate ligase
VTLKELLRDVECQEIRGSQDVEVRELVFDSRRVKWGDVFVAVRGTQVDGHKFIDKAVENGASVIVAEACEDGILPKGITCLRVANTREALALLASNYFGRPSEKLTLVGITGTNGKTTTATLLHGLLNRMGYRSGLLSTIENKIGEEVLPATHTTPDAVAINRLLAQMLEAGCSHAFMEVSSHALDQRRVTGLNFKIGVFTNITHDHLDYHKTFLEYIFAKKRLFDGLPKGSYALVNADDKRADVMVQNTQATIVKYALKHAVDVRARIIENSIIGLHLHLDGHDFHARLIGEFNAYNLLVAYASAKLLGLEPVKILATLSEMKAAEGRFDYMVHPATQTTAIVDYAHTPDALEKVLQTIGKLRRQSARVITVVGCGGDRDRTKRPKMAQVACELSNQVILTADNPRSEDPEAIIEEMEAGVPQSMSVLTITDRKQAIKTAIKLAQPGDIVLVAGKGHEKYQEVKGVKYPFDDKLVVQECLGL